MWDLIAASVRSEEASLVWRLIADGRERRMHRNTFIKKRKEKVKKMKRKPHRANFMFAYVAFFGPSCPRRPAQKFLLLFSWREKAGGGVCGGQAEVRPTAAALQASAWAAESVVKKGEKKS